MASKSKKATVPQTYPRITDEKSKQAGYMDDSKLRPHVYTMSDTELKTIIKQAIAYANQKSSRVILSLATDGSDNKAALERAGKELFDYFKKYYGDPASSAHACLGKDFKVVGRDLFRARALQKERMNSGWRYQRIAMTGAEKSKRFKSVSDIGTQECDFNAVIERLDGHDVLNLYVSVKNRTNTMGGQDWPKAIDALEEVAKNDKNREGPYLCVFGIAMEKGTRNMRRSQKNKQLRSANTEVWLSDFFWPFFTNYVYEDIITKVLDVLIEIGDKDEIEVTIPDEVLNGFGERCKAEGLLDQDGKFHDAYKLVKLFCTSAPKRIP